MRRESKRVFPIGAAALVWAASALASNACSHAPAPAPATVEPPAPVPSAEPLASSFVASEPRDEISDDQLASVVRVRLIADGLVSADGLSVEAAEGVVTLAGTVRSLLAKRRAIQIAERIKGVRAVIAQIAAYPPERPDAEIRKDVRRALFFDPATESFEIDVGVREGTVTLGGKVDSWAEKQIAGRVVGEVLGVRAVVNQIEVAARETRLDRDILRDVNRRLEIDAVVDDKMIRALVDDGRVTLTGTVGSADEKRRAVEDSWVAGVKAVDASKLDVEWWARDRLRRSLSAILRSDTEIERAVLDAYLFDPRVTSYRPDVEAHDGTVTLKGTVSSLAAKRAAGADARNTVGVLWVVNDLEVSPPKPVSDETLSRELREGLDRDSLLRTPERILVAVENGVAELSGMVASIAEKERAEALAERQKGVVDVENRITVIGRPLSGDALKQAILENLIWNPYVVSTNVSVVVAGSEVTLRGMVANWHAYRQAAETARRAGAARVINELRVATSEQEGVPSQATHGAP